MEILHQKHRSPGATQGSVLVVKYPIPMGNSDIIWQFVIPTNFNGNVGLARGFFKYCQSNTFILNLDIKLMVSNSF